MQFRVPFHNSFFGHDYILVQEWWKMSRKTVFKKDMFLADDFIYNVFFFLQIAENV